MIRLFTLVLAILVCQLFVTAQTKAKVTAGTGCTVAIFTFKCPKGFAIKNSKAGSEPFMAFQPAKKIAVFAFSPEKKMKESEIIQFSLSKSFERFFGVNYDDLKVKDSKDFSEDDKWSRFESSKFAKVGFDEKRKLAFHFQYALLKFKNKEILAGFIYDPEPLDAAEWFNDWLGGGFGDASDALQNLIVAITKEKRPEFSPGGPPPPGQAE